MRKHAQGSPLGFAACMVIAAVFLAGCGFGGDDQAETESEPEQSASASAMVGPTMQSTPVQVEMDTPTDACDNIKGKQQKEPAGTQHVVPVGSDKLYCLTKEATDAYLDQLSEKSDGLLVPLARSAQAGGSPQMILRDLVRLGCGQPTSNFFFWEDASNLYGQLQKGSPPDELTRDWPDSYAAAIAQDCF